MNCLPEDCGGVWEYANTLEKPEDDEYEGYMEWLGENFDPVFSDQDTVNESLQKKVFGSLDW